MHSSHIPCHLEQMLPELGYDVGFFCLLVEVLQTLDVCKVLLFIRIL
jgi:hypothetical protein